jgi:hypothetical protein
MQKPTISMGRSSYVAQVNRKKSEVRGGKEVLYCGESLRIRQLQVFVLNS